MCAAVQRTHIGEHCPVRLVIREEAELLLGLDGCPVSEMIIAHDCEALLRHPSGKMIIALNKLLHSVHDLKHSDHRSVARPFNCMDLRRSV